MNRYRVAVSLSLLLLCSGTASAADAVTYWNDKVIGVTIAGGRSNPETGVAAAYMHIAIYDAISSIDGRFTPFLTRVANVPPGASPEAAAAEAAYRILANLYPAASFPAIASQFATAYNDALNGIPNSQAKSDGRAVGLAAANGLIAKRQNDGFRANVPYVFLPLDAGVYQKTPGAGGTIATYAGPVTPWMAKFKPLAILSPDQFRVDGPPALGSRRWAKDFNEVKNFGAASTLPNSRSAEQEEIGLFGVDVDKNIVYRVLVKHCRPAPGGTGPSWLPFIGHTRDSLWSVDLFRCESIVLRSDWVLVVIDQFTRRLVGIGVHGGAVAGADMCRMFNAAIRTRRTASQYGSRSAVRGAPVDSKLADSGHRRNQDRAACAAVPSVRGARDRDDAPRIPRPCAVLECL